MSVGPFPVARAGLLSLAAILGPALAAQAPAPIAQAPAKVDGVCAPVQAALPLNERVAATPDRPDPDAVGLVLFHAFDLGLAERQSVLIGVEPAAGGKVPRLSIGRCRGEGFQELAFTRDGDTARLGFTAPEAAQYRVRVSAPTTQAAPFGITAKAITPGGVPTPAPLEPGRPVEGAFADGPAEIVSGQPYRLYGIALKRYDRIVVQASTPGGGPPLVQIGKLTAGLWQDYFEADGVQPFRHVFTFPDGRLGFVAPEDGIYTIRIHPGDAGPASTFALRVDKLAPGVLPAAPVRIRADETIQDALGLDGPTLAFTRSSSFLDPDVFYTFRPQRLYLLRVRAGQTIDFRLFSDKFSTHLDVGSIFPVVRRFSPTVGGEGSDVLNTTRVGVTFAFDGEVAIRVTTAREGGGGPFALVAKVQAPSTTPPQPSTPTPTPASSGGP